VLCQLTLSDLLVLLARWLKSGEMGGLIVLVGLFWSVRWLAAMDSSWSLVLGRALLDTEMVWAKETGSLAGKQASSSKAENR